jgi:exosortase
MVALPIREIALSLLVGFVVAASPLTGDDWGPSLVVGAIVAGGLIAYRLRTGPADTAGETPTQALSERFPASVIACLVLYIAVISPTLLWLWDQWTKSVWVNNHGIFIPLVVGYLAVNALRGHRSTEPAASPWGFAWLGTSLFLIVVDAYLETRYLSVVAIAVGLPGLSLLFLGSERTRLLRVPLAISLLAIPIPNAVGTDLYLRHATAAIVEPLVSALGFVTFREATVISVPNHTFVVADACSGFNTLYASMATAIVLACYVKTTGQRLILLLVAPLLALVANSLRVLSLVLLTMEWGNWVIDSPIHPGSGVAAFALAVGVLFVLSSRMSDLSTAPRPSP